MSFLLTGRIAVVTGGASGIGEACARLFAERGAKVVVADVNLDGAKAVASSIGGAAFEMNVRSPQSVEAAAERIEAEVGPVDITVCNAGVTQLPVPAEELQLDVWDRMQETDLRGVFVTAVAFGRHMAKRGKGAIVNIASITGMRATPVHAYASAKAAVISLTASLAADWGRSGVRVNCVSPGYTLTPLLQSLIDRGERDPASILPSTAMGRLVRPDEIARAVAFLASDEASAITGINVPVDAGWLVAASWHTYGGVPPARNPQGN
jgi:NAD(P)-dependent dehydrogenase (short-subunit alcohol dehydrogenase family)